MKGMMGMQYNNLYIVDNSDADSSVKKYLTEWCAVSKQMDIATGYLEVGGLLTLDGETVLPLNENDELKFSVSEKSLKLLRYGDSSFFDTLNKKLISLK